MPKANGRLVRLIEMSRKRSFSNFCGTTKKSLTEIFPLSFFELVTDKTLAYPLIDPTYTPFTKYFCKNGYTSRIGSVETTMVQYLTSSR